MKEIMQLTYMSIKYKIHETIYFYLSKASLVNYSIDGGYLMTGFSETIIERAWARSGGVCECEREGHNHKGRCRNTLIKGHRRDKYSYFGWEAHSKSGNYLDSVDDCEILCMEPCYALVMKK